MKVLVLVIILTFHLVQGDGKHRDRGAGHIHGSRGQSRYFDWSREIKIFYRTFVKLWEKREMAKLVYGYWSPKPLRMPPSEPFSRTRQAIVAAFEALFDSGDTDVSLSLDELVQFCGRDQAVTLFTWRAVNAKKGSVYTITGIHTFKRIGGRLRVKVGIWHATPASFKPDH